MGSEGERMKATILVTVAGNKVATMLNCDNYEQEAILGPVANEVRAVVEEALILADDLLVDVTAKVGESF